MSWREQVEEALRGENTRNTSDTRDESGPSVPIVPSVPAPAPVDPRRLLRMWHGRLDALDPAEPPEGFEPNDWWRLWLDASWLYETHGKYAVLNGWDAQSLFGVWVGYPPAGGLAQQLRGSRQLVFDGQRAVYRLWGVSSPVNVAAARGRPLIWELAR